MVDITYVREESGAPYKYGVHGWTKHEEEPGGTWSWRGFKEDKTYTLERTIFLTKVIETDVQLNVHFVIQEIELEPVIEEEESGGEESGEEGRSKEQEAKGIYFTYLDKNSGVLVDKYFDKPQTVSLTINQSKVFWPTAKVISQAGHVVKPEDLQQFYFLPSISMGTALSCVIGEISVTTIT